MNLSVYAQNYAAVSRKGKQMDVFKHLEKVFDSCGRLIATLQTNQIGALLAVVLLALVISLVLVLKGGR